MLGIRRFRGVAIDLFQGELPLFACDVVLDALRLAGELATADAGGKRHAAVANAGDPTAAFHDLKVYLQSERPAPHSVERLTFVLGSIERYYEFQEVLFRTFPDGA